MCGICGVIGEPIPGHCLYEALNLLQHRGQDGAGIATGKGRHFRWRNGMGLVREVFAEHHLSNLAGEMGVGQVRYPTRGSATHRGMIQPFYVNSPYGILMVHNGNLTNAGELQQSLWENDMRHLNTDSDSEVLLNVFARELQRFAEPTPKPEQIFKAVEGVHRHCRGAYSVVAILIGHGLVAFRDPHGIRPLSLGRRTLTPGDKSNTAFMVASESVALEGLGFKLEEEDIGPGEAIYVNRQGELFRKQCAPASDHRPCIFEYVYLARPDSTLHGVSVYRSRLLQGGYLAERILESTFAAEIDCVVPVPDTGRVVAQVIAEKLDLPLREGLMKNRYVGRTFIMPGQAQRRRSVRRKLNPIGSVFKDLNVLLVDDSIVRGTTSQEIVEMVRQAGARKVFFASAAPPVRFPNIYGIDMPIPRDLIAHESDEQQICREIKADGLVFQKLEDLKLSVQALNPDLHNFEDSIFTGDYVTEQGNRELALYLQELAEDNKGRLAGADDEDAASRAVDQ